MSRWTVVFIASVLVFSTLAQAATVVPIKTQSEGFGIMDNSAYGAKVSVMKDFDGDGKMDIAISASRDATGGHDAGAVYIFHAPYPKGTDLNATNADIVILGQSDEAFGESMDTGDFNGDGLSDLIIGAPISDSEIGRAYIFLGGNSTNRTSADANATLKGSWQGQQFGFSVINIGNLNGDKFDDFAVGALGAHNVLVYLGREHLRTDIITLPEAAADYPNPVDFTNGINSTGNTFGYGGASDEWDWQTGAYNGLNNDVHFTPVGVSKPYAELVIGNETINNGANPGTAGSGGYGVGFNITDVIYDSMMDGADLHLRFSWTTRDTPTASASIHGLRWWEGEVYWVKASIWNSTTNRTFLGWNQDGDNDPSDDNDAGETTDSTNEIFYMNGPVGAASVTEYSNRENFIVSDLVKGPREYYLDMGGKLSDWSTIDECLQVRIDDVVLETQIEPIVVLEGPKFPSGYGRALAGNMDVNADGYDDLIVGAPVLSEVHIYFGSPHFATDFTLYGQFAQPVRQDRNDTTDEPNTDKLKWDDAGAWPLNVGCYVVDRGQQMWIDSWNIGEAKGDLVNAWLYMEYRTDNNYNGNNWVRWAVEGDNWKQTDLQPVQTWGQQVNNWNDQNGPYNLHDNGLKTLSELKEMDLEFTNNAGGGGGGGRSVYFDYALIYFTSQMPANITIKGPKNGIVDTEFGASVASLGSINGDPYEDFIVGAPGMDLGKGAAYVFLGGLSLIGVIPYDDAFATFKGEAQNGHLGFSLASAGYFSFDKFPDIAIGEIGTSTLYIIRGGPRMVGGNISEVAQYSMISDDPNGLFSYSIAVLGDIDFGYADELLVGEPEYDGGTANKLGKVYIVYNENQDKINEPFLVDWYPKGDQTMNEGESLAFGVIVSPIDDLDIKYEWYMDMSFGGSTKDTFIYQPDYSSAGAHTIRAKVTCGFAQAEVKWKVDVLDVNFPPEVKFYPGTDPTIEEGDSIRFWANAWDPDNDPLSFSWSMDGTAQTGNSPAYLLRADYNTAGDHVIALDVSDGQFNIGHKWYLTIEDVNRPPVIDTVFPLTDPMVLEGMASSFNITAHDPDGDLLTVVWYLDGAAIATDTYSFMVMTEVGNTATRLVTVKVSDGEFTVGQSWTLSVTDGNQPPVIDLVKPPSPLLMDEGAEQLFWFQSHDPDGDQITTEWTLDGAKVIGDQGFNFRVPPSPNGKYSLKVTVTDGNLSASYTWDITINRRPIITGSWPSSGGSLVSSQIVDLGVKIKDADKDRLTVVWYISEKVVKVENTAASEAAIQSALPFVAPFDSVNSMIIKVVVSDGRLSTEQGWKFNITTVSNTAPTAILKYGPKLPKKGKAVSFDGSSSHDPENDIISYEWKFSDGTAMSGKNVSKTFSQNGMLSVTLTVIDSKGNTGSTTETLSFGGAKVRQTAESPLNMVLFVILLVVLVVMLLYQANRKGWLGGKSGRKDHLEPEEDGASHQARIDDRPEKDETEKEEDPAIEGGFEELPVEDEQ